MSSVRARSPRLVVCAALALAFVAAMGVVTPRSRVVGRERVARAVAARLGSNRVDDRLSWVVPDPSASGDTTLAPGDEPVVGRAAPIGASVVPAVVPAPAARGSAVRLAGAPGARSLASTPVSPSPGRAPPQA